jgi:DNA polymerase III epsilon subunit-like protein
MILIYADVETTGYFPEHGAEITEMGLVKVDGYRIIDLYYSFFEPDRSIPSDIVKEIGITDGMVKGFPKLRDRVDQIKLFLGRTPIIAYNARFEASFFSHYNIVGGSHQFLDLYPWVRDMRLSTANNKLQTILSYYGLRGTFGHRALSDAFALYNLVYHLRWVDRIAKTLRPQ